MGKSAQGRTKYEGNVDLLTKDQKKFLSNILGDTRKASEQAYSDLLKQPSKADVMSRGELMNFLRPAQQTYQDLMSTGTDQSAFQKSVVDPLMQQYSQQVLPAIQQRYVDANAGSSSALNQALAASANDLTTQLGQYYLPYMQNQQQTRLQAATGYQGLTQPLLTQGSMSQDLYKTLLGSRLSALSGLSGLSGQQTFQPVLSQQSGWMGPAIGALGTLGGAGILAMSSEKVKENIRDYDKGMEYVKDFDVKIFDYKTEVGGYKNKVGLIAENVPEEIRVEINGVKAVDLYGLIGILINSVKELNEKVEQLEKKHVSDSI